jgi:hypothetical protein
MSGSFCVRAAGALAAALALLTTTPAVAKKVKKPRATWQVSRVTDPLTGSTTCVVAAFDRIGKASYSRTGHIYPIVENNPVHGLLVGVSSGGRFRLPAGDILWRIDDKPFRQLKAADNPGGAAALSAMTLPTGTPEAALQSMQQVMANATRLSTALISTSTVASGPRAKEMLAEMLAGRGLLYRGATVAPEYGLPSQDMFRLGQYTKDGLVPIAIDDSFRAGLAACGVAAALPQ